ncbi:hypothetical protein EV379_1230 [Microterricola gilva]|uniref:DUF7341 domain-containing protein n=1 Tax=Microterricola gilva TaxID=393267 RepID=A0A4Q8AM01_9MICO|nr:hypothetical protein [Microterricola gilva]RZU64919.1 hypothetical protein EV379_1230 [Microterricola gilva]
MTDLLEAVEALTKPTRTKVIQDDGTVAIVVQDALLVQLETAIRSSMGGSTGGASLPSEGSPLDVGALFESLKITAAIGDWCRLVGVKPSRKSVPDLIDWHTAYIGRPSEADDFYISQLNGWVRMITAMFDRPREKDLPDPCPVCDAKSWWRDGAEYYRPLVVKYRPDDPVGSATALCRSCETVWNARELAFAIEQKEASS